MSVEIVSHTRCCRECGFQIFINTSNCFGRAEELALHSVERRYRQSRRLHKTSATFEEDDDDAADRKKMKNKY